MGRIKSALEIALERTESVKGDKSSINQFETKQKGKRLANEFLNEGLKSLDDEIKKCPKDEQASLKQGIFDVLISQIALPATKEEQKRIEDSCQGLNTIIGVKRFAEIAKQMAQIINQYMDEALHFEEAIKRQYAPKLRQKEEELSRRLGRHIKLDPFQDPEFAAFYNQNINALKANYQTTVDQFKEEAVKLFSPSGS